MKNLKEVSIFVPARALEHECNSEDANLKEKLKWALIRYYFNKDFFNPAVKRPFPGIFLEKIALKVEPLGYAVEAQIKVDKPVENLCIKT